MLLLIVTSAERLLSLTAVQLPIVNHLILYMLSSTKSELKRSLATLYPAIRAKLVSHFVLHITIMNRSLFYCRIAQ